MKRIFYMVVLFLMAVPAVADGPKLEKECVDARGYRDFKCTKQQDMTAHDRAEVDKIIDGLQQLKLKEECTDGQGHGDIECAKRYEHKWFIATLTPPKGGLFCTSAPPPERFVEWTRRDFRWNLRIVPSESDDNYKLYRRSKDDYIILVRGLAHCWLLTANYR